MRIDGRNGGNNRRRNENDRHRILKLPKKARGKRYLFCLLQPIRPVCLKPLCRLNAA